MESIEYKIEVVRNGIFPSNTYILINIQQRDCIVIDPGLDTGALKEKIEELNVNPIAVIATHGHFDHIGGVSFIKEQYQIPFYLHEADLKISKSANFYLKMVKLKHQIVTPIPDFLFKNKKEEVLIGNFLFKIYNYPGHTNGSCLLQFGHHLFSGDIMYRRGLGFNHFPGEDQAKLRLSVKDILATFPGETIIYPGHGETALLSEIKNENTALADFLNLKEGYE